MSVQYPNRDFPAISDPSRGLKRHDFQPADDLTIKLRCCLEAVRDLRPAIEPFIANPDHASDKRRVKLLAAPVFNFVVAVDDLYGGFVEKCRSGKSTKLLREFETLRQQFRDAIPFRKSEPLKVVRDKIGAHIDRDAILGADKVWEWVDFDLYLNICMRCLQELNLFLKQDGYAWSCFTEEEGVVRLMTVDGVLIDLAAAGTESEYIRSVAHTESPLDSVAIEVNEFVLTIIELLRNHAPPGAPECPV